MNVKNTAIVPLTAALVLVCGGGDGLALPVCNEAAQNGASADDLTNNNWLAEPQTAFVSAQTAAQLIMFDNIGLAIGEYQPSMGFVDAL